MKLQIEEANHDVAKGLKHQLKGSRFHVAPMSPTNLVPRTLWLHFRICYRMLDANPFVNQGSL